MASWANRQPLFCDSKCLLRAEIIAGIIYGLIVLIRKLIHPDTIVGWSSIAVLVSVIGGVMLFGLGIVGEYVGRIYMSLNSMPQYVVSDTANLDDQTQKRLCGKA